jgi:hypothetical protein
MAKLHCSGARSGMVECEGPRPGDALILTRGLARVVVVSVDSNIHGPVYVCVDSTTSADRIVLPKEVHAISRRRAA